MVYFINMKSTKTRWQAPKPAGPENRSPTDMLRGNSPQCQIRASYTDAVSLLISAFRPKNTFIVI
jgi:hypothetical protein